MANELQEFLKLLGRIITWILLWTLNLICFCLFLISLVALWRTLWIFQSVTSSSSMSRFRENAATQFFLIILDILVLPFGIIGFCIPTRTFHAITGVYEEINHSFNSNSYYSGENQLYCYKARWVLFYSFWFGLADIFCLIFGLISIIVPTRSIAFFRACYYHRNQYFNDRYCELRVSWLANFVMALADIISIPHGILAIFIPTRTYLIVTQFIDIYQDNRHRKWHSDMGFENTLKYNLSYRLCAISNFWLGLLDLIVLVGMAAISCIFVVRIWELIKLYGRYSVEYKDDNYGKLRIAVCAHFILSVIDLLCMIAAILVFITLIRTYPLFKDVQSYFNDPVNPNDIILEDIRINYNTKLRQRVFKHFSFLFLDILFVPLMILCFLSIYKGIEIYHLIKDAPKFDENRMNMIRKTVLINFAVLVFDVIFMFPLLLIILVTIYRFPALYKHIKEGWNVYYFNRDIELQKQQILTQQQQDDNDNNDEDDGGNNNLRDTLNNYGSINEAVALLPRNNNNDNNIMTEPENCRIHIVMNTLVILCDIIFIVIAILLICITGYRVPYLIGIFRQNLVINADNDFMEEYRSIFRQRSDIFRTGFFIFIDIPCAIMCLLVFITIWRAFKMYDLLKNHTNDTYDFRKHSWVQFWSLIRDIFFLIPFSIIIVTLFRLPMLILAIMSKLRTPRTNITDIIYLTIDECTLEFPEKGKPRIHIKRGTKPLNFTLNTEKAKKVYSRLFVLGIDFWKDVELVFGSSIATAGQSMLPNKLSHGINENDGGSKGFEYDKIDSGTININDICFTLQTPEIGRKTILENINKFPNKNTKLLFQLEHDDEGILFIIALEIADLVKCAENTDGLLELERGKHFGLSLNDINGIRGTAFLGIIDMFWIIVGIEFAKWLMDIIHLTLFLILICVPWRWAQCLYYLCGHESKWYLKEELFVIGILEHAYFIYIKLYDLLFEQKNNNKIGYWYNNRNYSVNIQYEKWCDKIEKFWEEYGDELQIDTETDEKKQEEEEKYNDIDDGYSKDDDGYIIIP